MNKSFPAPLTQEEHDHIWRLAQMGHTQKKIAEMTNKSVATVRRVERLHGFRRRQAANKTGGKRFDLNTVAGAEAAIVYHEKQKAKAEIALREALEATLVEIRERLNHIGSSIPGHYNPDGSPMTTV